MNEPDRGAVQPTPEYLDPRRAAEYLLVSVATLGRWRMHGTGPAFVLCSPRMVRYSRAALDQFMRNRERLSTSA